MGTPFAADTMTKRSVTFDDAKAHLYTITDANQTGLDLGDTWTIETWARITRFTDAVETEHRFCYKWNSGGNLSYMFRYIFSSPNQNLNMLISDDGTTTTLQKQLAAPVSVGVWHHVAATYDKDSGGEKFVLYFDGVDLGAGGETGSGTSAPYNGTDPFIVGGPSGVPGSMCDLRIWDDVRTATEIRDNRYVELVGDEAGLVAYWPFKGNAVDLTTNDNDMVVSGGSPDPYFTYDTPL